MNIYCKSCGAATPYGSKKPKFCSNCGESFISVAKTQAQPAKPQKPQKQVVAQETYDDEDIIDDSPQIPNISRLEADIDSGRIQGVKLGEIAGTANEDDEGYIRPSDGSEISPKQALKQLQQEGGSIRQKGKS
jgi:predicted RNA-binding Zn-ribbon protein involved in translation (DUF1610 family)